MLLTLYIFNFYRGHKTHLSFYYVKREHNKKGADW